MKAHSVTSLLMTLLATVVAGVAGAETAKETAHSIKARYPLSTIEVGNIPNPGVVAKTGLVLRLEADAPALAHPIRAGQHQIPTGSRPRDYARVEVMGAEIVRRG